MICCLGNVCFHLAGFSLIKARSQAMQDACRKSTSCMMMVSGLEEIFLQDVISSTETYCSHACIASYIFPGGFVIAGNTDRVVAIEAEVKKLGATTKRVKVSGAFHSCLMSSAVPKLRAVLEEVELKHPSFPVYSNVTGLPYSSVEDIRTGLTMQITHPVLWLDTMTHMIKTYIMDGPGKDGQIRGTAVSGMSFMELGPGKQLKGMLRRINKTAHSNCDNLMV